MCLLLFVRLIVYRGVHIQDRPGPKVLKNLCSTRLSMKFKLLIITEITKIGLVNQSLYLFCL